ncbi:MAG: glutathione S-transferase family protein [Pseudomonadota bacterium]
MRTLHHLPVHGPSRTVRVALLEKGLEFDTLVEKIWERDESFLTINPAGDVPVLRDSDGTVVPHDWIILEYLEETYPDTSLMGKTPLDRIEARRLFNWFGRKFAEEVSDALVSEKILKRFLGSGGPDSKVIRAGKENIHYHLEYIGYLAERRNWLGGDDFGLADIAAVAHLSAVDYLGDIPWDAHEGAKHWYARAKSRPSVRPLLADSVPGTPPPAHYADLDF